MAKPDFEALEFRKYEPEDMVERSRTFLGELRRRRTVRHFSSREVPREVIENCLAAAGTAPSGANQQPWHFVVVSDPETKGRIRRAAEVEERAFYDGRASQEWLEALEHLGTDPNKPFLQEAPFLIVVFQQRRGVLPDGRSHKHYYTTESTGLATGMLILALHNAGLASLTHTPSPMGFLNRVLARPNTERPFLILVVGYPAADAMVPKVMKKTLDEIATFVE